MRASRPKNAACRRCTRSIRPSKSGLCSRCWPIEHRTTPTKYFWTEKQDELLRAGYAQGGKEAIVLLIDRMVELTGYPRHIVSQRAGRLGLTNTGRQRWTKTSLARLRTMAERDLSPKAISVALGRSYESVVAQLDHLKISRRYGLNHADAAQLLGVSTHLISRWVGEGKLRNDGQRIRRSDVEEFFWQYQAELDLRTVQQMWLHELLERAAGLMQQRAVAA